MDVCEIPPGFFDFDLWKLPEGDIHLHAVQLPPSGYNVVVSSAVRSTSTQVKLKSQNIFEELMGAYGRVCGCPLISQK